MQYSDIEQRGKCNKYSLVFVDQLVPCNGTA